MSKGKQQKEEAIRDVFVAHVEEDADVALEIALGLEEAGYSTWCYEVDNIPGPSYLVQTGQRIEQAKAVVVVISRHSIGSHQVTREVVRAHESGKYFIPIRRDISHIEFQNRQPEWREAIGAATSIDVPKEGAASIVPRIITGLKALGIQPAKKADSARIEQIYKGISELLVPTRGLELEHGSVEAAKGPELEHGPAEAAKGTADLTAHVERPVEGLKRVINLRWFFIAGVLLCLGFIMLIVGTVAYSPTHEPWDKFYLMLLIGALLFIAPGAYCLRRGIAQAHSSKPTQGKIPGWWWLLPIVLGPIGGMIAWLKQRDVDWRKASNLLTLGIVLSVLWTIPYFAWKASVQPTFHMLTTNISPSGAGSVSPSGAEYESGEEVTVTASPASGYTFDHWSGSATGATSTITITMDSDKSVTAIFRPVFKLATSISPAGGGSISLNPDRSVHKAGIVVMLSATAAEGYTFDSWGGDVTGRSMVTTIIMDADKSVTAYFSTYFYKDFEDDFSNPDSGWARRSYENYDSYYEDGEYHILVKKDYWAAWDYNLKAGRFRDFILEIDARLVSESNEGSSYGVIFRVQDHDSFYRFLIEDGCYLVGTKTGGVWTELQGWTDSVFINRGNSTNHLKVVCQGSRIEVYVNGHHLTTVTDDSFAEGYVGVIVDTDKAGADAAFDNTKVYTHD